MVSDEILSRFEQDVRELAEELNRLVTHQKASAKESDRVQREIEVLREETRKSPNMLKEARLKSLLGELKTRLQRQAEEGRRAEELHRTFEEQVLSLAVLYNDRLEGLLTSYRAETRASSRSSIADSVLSLTRRRDELQGMAAGLRLAPHQRGLDQYPDLSRLAEMERSRLLLARGFLMDREAALTEQIERAHLEEMEIRRQLRLESRLKEAFTTLPDQRGGSPRDVARKTRGDEARLQALEREKSLYRASLSRAKAYLRTVERRLGALPREPALP
jgi:hypothetical protein